MEGLLNRTFLQPSVTRPPPLQSKSCNVSDLSQAASSLEPIVGSRLPCQRRHGLGVRPPCGAESLGAWNPKRLVPVRTRLRAVGLAKVTELDPSKLIRHDHVLRSVCEVLCECWQHQTQRDWNTHAPSSGAHRPCSTILRIRSALFVHGQTALFGSWIWRCLQRGLAFAGARVQSPSCFRHRSSSLANFSKQDDTTLGVVADVTARLVLVQMEYGATSVAG